MVGKGWENKGQSYNLIIAYQLKIKRTGLFPAQFLTPIKFLEYTATSKIPIITACRSLVSNTPFMAHFPT